MDFKIFDAHCDTAFELLEKKQRLKENSLHLDLKRMEEYQTYFQIFAAFVDQKNIRTTPFLHCRLILENLKNEINDNNETIALIEDISDYETVWQNKKIGAILSIEGGEALEGSLENIRKFYQMGVRLITLTWNYANELADGILEPRGGGLTDFGKKAVSMMEELGILIDVSHLSEAGFWDVAAITRYPFIASHSCVKSLCGHPRNLSDEQIYLLIDRDCGMGINFYPDFLTEKTECSIEDVIRHMEYVLNLGGERILGLGTDFDGVSDLPCRITGVESIKDLIKTMKNYGFSDDLIEKISFGNFYRIFYEIMAKRK